MRSRLLLSVVAGLGLHPSLPAQLRVAAPTNEDGGQARLPEILAKLRSKDSSEIAWGAHLAAELGMQKAVPEIRKALVFLGESNGVDYDALGMALLDSLIRLKAKVSPAELEPCMEEPLLAPAMVLMSRRPRQHEALLLEIFDRHSGEYWLAAGNLLTSIGSKRIAASLLEGLEGKVVVHLIEQKVDRFESGSWICGGTRWAPPEFVVPANHPPTPYYHLSRHNLTQTKLQTIAELLADGKNRVYIVRSLRESRRYQIHRACSLDLPEYKLQLIAQLLRTRVEALPFRLSVERDMRWRDASTYARKILIERQMVEGSYYSLVNRLCCEGYCSRPEVSHLRPIVQVSVSDYRSENLPELPEIEGVNVYRLDCEEEEVPEEEIQEVEITEEVIGERIVDEVDEVDGAREARKGKKKEP